MARLRVCPRTVLRYPTAWWFVWLAFVKGIPAALGIQSLVSTPESIYANWTLQAWGIQLMLAASVAALGLITCDHRIQHWGFMLLAVATVYDLVAIFYYYGVTRPAYTLLYIGFATACVLRSLPSHGRGLRNGQVRNRGR